MTTLINTLERGIAITTPIFFVIVLVALLRVLRTLDLSMKTLIFLQRRFEKLEYAVRQATSPEGEGSGIETQMEKDWKNSDKPV